MIKEKFLSSIKKGKCSKCGRERSYSDRFDSFYCSQCDIWSETKCSDPECSFCKDRPDRPSLVVDGKLWIDLYKDAKFRLVK